MKFGWDDLLLFIIIAILGFFFFVFLSKWGGKRKTKKDSRLLICLSEWMSRWFFIEGASFFALGSILLYIIFKQSCFPFPSSISASFLVLSWLVLKLLPRIFVFKTESEEDHSGLITKLNQEEMNLYYIIGLVEILIFSYFLEGIEVGMVTTDIIIAILIGTFISVDYFFVDNSIDMCIIRHIIKKFQPGIVRLKKSIIGIVLSVIILIIGYSNKYYLSMKHIEKNLAVFITGVGIGALVFIIIFEMRKKRKTQKKI